jgi:hypothetical protein
MKEGNIPIRGTKGLSTRPRCITLITQPTLIGETVILKKKKAEVRQHICGTVKSRQASEMKL